MRRIAFSALSLLILAGSTGVQAQTPTTAAPIVIPGDGDLASPESFELRDWLLEASCSDELLQPLRMETPPPALLNSPGALGRMSPADVVLDFDIDTEGRIGNLRRRATPLPIPPTGARDIEASLMGWRFPPRARRDCRITAKARSTPLAAAPEALKARALALSPASRRATLLRTLERPGDDCRRRPVARQVTGIDPAEKPPPGARAWATLRFDVEADGATSNIEVIAASDDRAWVAAARRSVAEAVHREDRPARGCVIAFDRYGDKRSVDVAAAPDWRPLNHCTPAERARLTHRPLDYPADLSERGIEGWALVRFDIASWGQIGPVEVIASEPLPAFGDQARQMLVSGRTAPAFQHAKGCVDRFIFRLNGGSGEGG